MPNINLIAIRREERKRLERLASQLFIGLGASLGVFLLLGFYLAARQLSISADMSAADQRMEKLQPTLDEIKQIEAERLNILPRVETLEMAKIDTLRWRAAFLGLARAMPSDTWLTDMTSNVPSGANQPEVTVHGITSSQTQLANLITSLQSNFLFDKVNLEHNQTVQSSPQDKTLRVQFEISTTVRSAQKPEPPKKDKDDEKKTAQARLPRRENHG